MHAGQTYRGSVSVARFCDVTSHQEHERASLRLLLRSPDQQGKWSWGEWSEEIPLPQTMFSYLWQGATSQAPTLRETARDDGNRVAVLDLILEVPAKSVPALYQETRVLG